MSSTSTRPAGNPARAWITGGAGLFVVLTARWALAWYDAPFWAMHQAALYDGQILFPPEVERDYKTWLRHHHPSALGIEIALMLAGFAGIALLHRAIEKSTLRESHGIRFVTGVACMLYILSAVLH